MIIRNAAVYTKDCRFRPGSILIRHGLIERIRLEAEETPDPSVHGTAGDSDGYPALPGSSPDEEYELDASGCYAIPGLVDIHFHGCMGADFSDGTQEAIRTIAEYEALHGITAICPAALTLPAEELCRVLREGALFARRQKARKQEDGFLADLVGINMEGPFISPVKKGAQNGNSIIGYDDKVCERFLRAGEGLVKIIGLAPEENPGAVALIGRIGGGVRVSLAHTNADYETAMAAFRAGASHVVHLFNAMPEYLHRSPGVVGAAADSPHVSAELICDGNHVHASAVRGAFALFGAERLVLVSDSLRQTGLGDGRILLGGLDVVVEGTRATLAGSGTLAGSVTNLMDCMRILVREMGIGLETAVRCASINPARVIGEEARRGSLEEGKIGDVVLLDREDLQVRAVVRAGRLAVGQDIQKSV